jgi:probable phosphoglycerate mutase
LGSKKIYLIRHGQTDLNLKGIVQGSGVDAPLNEQGRQQALRFYETYKHVPFQKVYTSTLQRAYQSLEKFIQSGISHESLPGLNEISWGTKEGQPITREEDLYYHQMLEAWQRGETHLRIEGGESPEDVVKRLAPAINSILSRTQEEYILVCMHGRAMRILLTMLLRYPLRSMDMFEHSNLCLYLLEHTGSLCTVRTYHNTEHL